MTSDARVITGVGNVKSPLPVVSGRVEVTPQQQARQQVQFAVDFAERDLGRSPQSEWPSLGRELMQFSRGQAMGAPRPGPGRFPKRYPKKMLLKLQGEVRQLFRWSESGNVAALSVRPAVTVTYEFGQPGGKRPPVLYMTGSIRDVFMTVLVHALRDAGTDVVGRCVCGRLFARMRRQKYCTSTECAERRNKTYWAAYIRSPKGVAARKRQYAKGGNWTFGARRKGSAGKRVNR